MHADHLFSDLDIAHMTISLTGVIVCSGGEPGVNKSRSAGGE
jgi:hypothetical protein